MNSLVTILAQAHPPDSYSGIGWIVVGLGALALALNQMDEFLQRRKDKPSAAEVQQQAHGTFATHAELQRVEGKVDKLEVSLATLTTAISVNGDTRRQSIEAKVEAARKENASLTEGVRKELSEQIAGIEGRVIATLKNTGAI